MRCPTLHLQRQRLRPASFIDRWRNRDESDESVAGSAKWVFVHIPRTGGTNLWHSVCHAFSDQGCPVRVEDVFAYSIHHYKTILAASRTATDFGLNQIPSNFASLIHHHTSYGLWRDLGPQFRYFTLLRDPVERAISHYFHSLSLYFQIDPATGNYVLSPKAIDFWHGDDALPTLLEVAKQHNLLSPEAIVAFTALHHGLARNFYCDLFARYLGIADEWALQQTPRTLVDARTVSLLSHAIPSYFQHLFFDLATAYDFLERTFQVTIHDRNRMRNAVWRPTITDLDALRAALTPYFEYDYLLLSKLRARMSSLHAC
ncbi:MAG TPA: hypothetical protein VHZ24_14480 [Pirellulales bacterium]|jgi:hypothetical protein|nr:hypothetical protein [Pirellulales bacterium]